MRIGEILALQPKDIDINDKLINIDKTLTKTKSGNVIVGEKTKTYESTRCIEAGIPAPVLQKLLGHKDISVTINTYTTIFNKFKEDALNNYIIKKSL